MNHEFISNLYSLVFYLIHLILFLLSFNLCIHVVYTEEMTPISEEVIVEEEPLYHFLEHDQVS